MLTQEATICDKHNVTLLNHHRSEMVVFLGIVPRHNLPVPTEWAGVEESFVDGVEEQTYKKSRKNCHIMSHNSFAREDHPRAPLLDGPFHDNTDSPTEEQLLDSNCLLRVLHVRGVFGKQPPIRVKREDFLLTAISQSRAAPGFLP
jgi:hypothetical protein